MDEARDAVPEGASSEVDEAFARLEELHGRLPAMEEHGARLARAKAAAEVLRLEGEPGTARILLAAAETRAAFERAQGEGDGAAVEERRRALLHAGSLRGFRVGPAQSAEAALSRALDEGRFADAGEAHAAALDEAGARGGARGLPARVR